MELSCTLPVATLSGPISEAPLKRLIPCPVLILFTSDPCLVLSDFLVFCFSTVQQKTVSIDSKDRETFPPAVNCCVASISHLLSLPSLPDSHYRGKPNPSHSVWFCLARYCESGISAGLEWVSESSPIHCQN